MTLTRGSGAALAAFAFLLAACASVTRGDDGDKGSAASSKPWQPIEQEAELGHVRWERSYAQARAKAKQTGRPLFVLFDEVPG